MTMGTLIKKRTNREIREIHEFHAHLAVETDLAVEISFGRGNSFSQETASPFGRGNFISPWNSCLAS